MSEPISFAAPTPEPVSEPKPEPVVPAPAKVAPKKADKYRPFRLGK